MPAQTWAQWSATHSNLVAVKKLARTTGLSFITLQSAILAALKGDRSGAVFDGVALDQRSSLGAVMDSTAAMNAHLEDLDLLVGNAASGEANRIAQLRRYMHANSKTFLSRGITYGSPTAGGSNTGTGRIVRLVKDSLNYDLEACPIGSYEARCIQDANTGTQRNAERWSVRTTLALGDSVEFTGGGESGNLTALNNLSSMLANAGFDDIAGDAATPTSLPSWTLGGAYTGGTDYLMDSTNTFLPKVRSTEARYSLRIITNTSYSQRLDAANKFLALGVPFIICVRCGRSFGTGDGTLSATFGARTNSLASGSASAGWNDLFIPVAPSGTNLFQTTGSRLYYDYLKADPFTFTLTLASRTTGYWNVDDIIVAPMVQIGAHWYAALAGATPWFAGQEEDAAGDTFTWSDALAGSDSIRQYWFYRDYGESLPHSGSPSETDP